MQADTCKMQVKNRKPRTAGDIDESNTNSLVAHLADKVVEPAQRSGSHGTGGPVRR